MYPYKKAYLAYSYIYHSVASELKVGHGIIIWASWWTAEGELLDGLTRRV